MRQIWLLGTTTACFCRHVLPWTNETRTRTREPEHGKSKHMDSGGNNGWLVVYICKDTFSIFNKFATQQFHLHRKKSRGLCVLAHVFVFAFRLYIAVHPSPHTLHPRLLFIARGIVFPRVLLRDCSHSSRIQRSRGNKKRQRLANSASSTQIGYSRMPNSLCPSIGGVNPAPAAAWRFQACVRGRSHLSASYARLPCDARGYILWGTSRRLRSSQPAPT